MSLCSLLEWGRRLVGGSEPIDASVGVRPGDIVEVNELGAARVVGRRLHLASERPDASEEAIRDALARIYGDDAASLDNVTAGTNVVVFRKTQNA
jgi:hypothetical protein